MIDISTNKASTISEAFSLFSSNLEPSEASKQNIKKRHSYIREILSNKITCDGRIDSYLSGSYARHTVIEPINDVDIVIVFDKATYWNDYKDNAIGLLKLTQKKLKETYPSKDFTIQSHSIGIVFEQVPDVDIVPAFVNNYEDDIYVIPVKESGTYIKTSPRIQAKKLSDCNEFHGKKFIPLVKMMKCFRNKLQREYKNSNGEGLKIKSFHLEALLMNILTTPFTGFPQGIEKVFSQLGNQIYLPCLDPAGLSGELGYYLSSADKNQIQQICNKIYAKIQILLTLQQEGNHEDAIDGWKEIFGPPFPSSIRTDKSKYKKESLSTNFPETGKNYGFGEM